MSKALLAGGCWRRKSDFPLRDDYWQRSSDPVDGPALKHTEAAPTGLNGLLIKKKKVKRTLSWQCIGREQRRFGEREQEVNVMETLQACVDNNHQEMHGVGP